MRDMIIANTGNSRYLRTSLEEGTTWEEAFQLMRQGRFPFDLNGLNNDGIEEQGTALTAGNLLPDEVVTMVSPSSVPSSMTPGTLLRLLVSYALRFIPTWPGDADDLVNEGIYQISASCENQPSHPATGVYAAIVVYRVNDDVYQMFYHTSGIWRRYKRHQDDSFGAWTKIMSQDDVATTTDNGLMSAADKAMMETSVVRGNKAAPTGTTNLDGFTTSGVYWLSSSIYTSGWPEAEGSGAKNALLVVFYDGGGARVQELTMYNGQGMNRRYCRMYINSQWYPWRNIVTGPVMSFEYGTTIQANTNLNNITDPGNYRASDSTVASTLSNSPITNEGFLLEVFRGSNSNYLMQKLTVTSGWAIYLRSRYSNTWGSWYKYTGTAV